MNFVNKGTMQAFPLPLVILLTQTLATLVILLPLRHYCIIVFPAPTLGKARELLIIVLLYMSNTAFALCGLSSLSIPVWSSLKRLTPVVVLLIRACWKRKLPQRDVAGSVCLVMLGCVVAGLGDVSFAWQGYCYALLSCLLQATYLLLVERSGAERGVGSSELLLYSAAISAPALLLLAVLSGEAAAVPRVVAASPLAGGALAALVLACSLFGCLLNWSLYCCTNCNSALTTTIVGVLKGVAATGLGFCLLGGVPLHWLNVSGVALNTAGGVWYSIIVYREKYVGAARRSKHPFPATASMLELGQYQKTPAKAPRPPRHGPGP